MTVETSKALVKIEANSPVRNRETLQALIDERMDAISQVIPQHVTPERLARTLLTAINKNPDLLKCTQSSIIQCLMNGGELGLDLSGTLGEAYIVPFNVTIKTKGANNVVQDVKTSQALLIPGFRGLAKLARNSGEVKRIEAEVVFENDKFSYKKGTFPEITFEPLLSGERGKPMGAYALAEMNGEIQADWMSVKDINKIRDMSKAKDGPAWTNNWSEMARKTVFRRLCKWLPLSAEKFNRAIEISDNEFELEKQISPIRLDASKSRATSLLERINGSIPAESTIIEEEYQDTNDPNFLSLSEFEGIKIDARKKGLDEKELFSMIFAQTGQPSTPYKLTVEEGKKILQILTEMSDA